VRERVEIVDIPIDYIPMDALVEHVAEAARARRHFQIATVNLDFLVRSHRDPEIKSILRATSINMPDGAPVVWAGKLIGVPDTERVAGADFVPQLMEAAAREHPGVFFLGGEHDAAQLAADKLTTAHPGLQISVYEPPRSALSDMDDDAIMQRIEAAQPQILLVAFGHPKQEQWIRRNAERLPMVAVGVGCSLDLIAGLQSRAPVWAHRIGLEWAYRLLHEPRRLFRRYATDALWLVKVLLPWAVSQRRAGRRGAGPAPESEAKPTSVR
jgi:N-acetylglucosaminyldiphosphoundecaprenol N-acetyl-beta-D-mannosaminyltransferase